MGGGPRAGLFSVCAVQELLPRGLVLRMSVAGPNLSHRGLSGEIRTGWQRKTASILAQLATAIFVMAALNDHSWIAVLRTGSA
jgi:hypothetical protein